MVQNVADAAAFLQNPDQSDPLLLDPEQRETLSTSISILNAILEQSKNTGAKKKTTDPDNDFANSTSINHAKDDENNNLYDGINRVLNFQPDIVLPHPFTHKCEKCDSVVSETPFFKCLNCKCSWHDKCVQNHDRFKQIKGYWACEKCHQDFEEHEKIMNYNGDRSSMRQLRNVRQAEMLANLKVNDPYFHQPRLSQFPFQFPVPIAEKASTRAGSTTKKSQKEIPKNVQQENQKTNQQEIQQNIPKKAIQNSRKENEMLAEKLRIDKAIEDLKSRKFQLEATLQHHTKTPLNGDLAKATSFTSIPDNATIHSIHSSNSSQHSHNGSYAPTQGDIARMVEESLRRMNMRQHQEDSNELSRRLIENQIKESQKKTYKLLPKVTKVGYEWKIFYTAFLDSMNLFTPNENVVRLQNAIQCPEIKKLGGINLFNSSTYEQTLKDIDKRIGKPEKMLIREKQKLIGFNKLGNNETKEIMDFIQEVKAYSTLVDKIGSFGDKNDQALIARLSRILPDRLLNLWTKDYSKIKEETDEVLVSDLSRFLDKQIDTFETSLLFNQMDPYGDLKQKNIKPNIQQDPKLKKNKKESFFFHKTNEDVAINEPQNSSMMSHSTNGEDESPARFCWFHQRKSHSSLSCYGLLSKKGNDVQKLAKSKGICTICSGKAHNPCPLEEKYTCPIPDCISKHAIIFCPKRKCQAITAIPQRPSTRQSTQAAGTRNKRNQINNPTHTIRQENNNCNIELPQTAFDALQFSMQQQNDGYKPAWMIREISMHANCQSNSNVPSQNPTTPSLVSVVIVTLESSGRSVKCALLLDSGSTTSLLDEEYADLMHLKGPKKELKLSWSGGKERIIKDSMIVRAKATGIHENARSFDICFRTVRNLGMPPQDFNAIEMRNKFKHLKDLPLVSYSRLIGVIGTDQWRFFKQLKWIEQSTKNSIEAPVAFLTPLGYCIIGSSYPLSQFYEHMNNFHIEEISMLHTSIKMSEQEEEELMKMEQRALGLNYRLPYENDRAIEEEQAGLKALIDKVKYIPEEKIFEAPLLWNTSNVSLPTEDSFKTSYRRLKILLKNAERMGNFEDTKAQVENLIQKGYARKLSRSEIKNDNPKAFYIPIFISCPKGKRTRMIWDCAAKINGKSLNDYLYTGPNLYNDLFDIIIRFREGKHFVKSDVMEMFHQIQICAEDRPALRFLFATSLDGPIEHFEMNRMIFGAACSPTTSQFVKNSIAKSCEATYPEAAKAIIHSMYVDDFVHSFNDINYGKKLINDTHRILKSGGFNLVKMKASNPEILETVLQNMSSEDRSNSKLLSLENKEKLLGYIINYESDSIALVDFREKFSKDILNGTKVPTKKELLKFLMSIYDPLGLLVFFTSKIKLIYHWVCKDKIDWDESISEKQMSYWRKVLQWLPEIMQMEIPRSYLNDVCINPRDTLIYQLIIMGDAGKESLCTVAYIRVKDGNNKQVGTQLIASKSYIVPIKQKRTIPELELDVACKNVKFKEKMKASHSIKFNEIIFITDSSCVYNWIVNGAHKPTVYMNNRLKKIRDLSTREQWSWIKSELQVADYGTKFESIPQLSAKNEWFQPEIFRLPEDDWINSKPPNETTQEVSHHMRNYDPVYAQCKMSPKNIMIKIITMIMIFLKSFPLFTWLINNLKLLITKLLIPSSYETWQFITENHNKINLCKKYSSWNKLLKMSQLVLRWKWKIRIKRAIKSQIETSAISKWNSKEFQEHYAEMVIIRKAQNDCYLDEIITIQSGNKLSQKHNLFKHNPFLDEFGILRITTRLSAQNNHSRDKINPIILPNHHPVTELIIMQYHCNNHHAHVKTIVANLLQRFHIPNIQWTVKRIIKTNCYKCKKFNAKPDIPMMGDLPSYRLATHTDPFTYTIVDVCGPFTITMNRRHQKRWLFVFSCLTTRAIHIEILYSMTAQSCLMAFQNFINLRGAPSRVISDQGSNFLGAKNILKEMETKWNEKLKDKDVITNAIQWDFNPAKASHMNGSVERMIGLIKNVLRNLHETLNKKLIIPGDEEFRCLICEVIGMLNNRPLTMIPLKDTNNCFLTPNHFLLLHSNFQTNPNNKTYNKCMIKEWQDVKALVNTLWDHFHRVYVNEIMHRDKWINFKKPLCVGDLVVLADPSINNLWRLGVITEVHIGSQNQSRKVTVRLGKRSVINDYSNKNRDALMRDYRKEKFTEVTRPTSQVAPLNLFVSEMYQPDTNQT